MPQLTGEGHSYGRSLTLSEILHLVSVLAQLPFFILWISLKNLFHQPPKIPLRRRILHSILRWANHHLTIPQMQYLIPGSVQNYTSWINTKKKQGIELDIIVEDLVEDTKIMWIGKRKWDNVVLCVHGGAYVSPLTTAALDFWYYLQQEIKLRTGQDVGFAVLGYALVPEAGFPKQLHQLTIAVQHLLALGVKSNNLQIIGDSAGGHLILSFLSHLLQPVEGIRTLPLGPKSSSVALTLEAPLKGVYLLSPWVCMKSTSASYNSNTNQLDILSKHNVDIFEDLFLDHSIALSSSSPYFSSSGIYPHIDHLNVPNPQKWYANLGRVVERLLITVGSEEVFRDDIIAFAALLEKVAVQSSGAKLELKLVVQEGGIHDDPILDFMLWVPKENIGTLTPIVVSWLKEGSLPT